MRRQAVSNPFSAGTSVGPGEHIVVGFEGMDHTGRPNHVAHQAIEDPYEQPMSKAISRLTLSRYPRCLEVEAATGYKCPAIRRNCWGNRIR